ncbi:MAG: hypothetical protein KAJ49_05185 [Arcobacteraceae bacterium]|nr:hypothetical protein [Arcobacteraceae bacterium]
MKKILAGSLVATSLLFGSNSAEININNDTLELVGEFLLNHSYQLSDEGNYYFTVNYLGSENQESTVGNTKNKKLVTTGLKIMNPYIDDRGLSLGIGIKAVWADNYEKDFFATPLEVFAKYEINEQLSLDMNVGYSPKVLTHADGETYKDGKIKVNYKVIDNGYVYVGARSIETTYKNNAEIKFDDNVFFGYKVQF